MRSKLIIANASGFWGDRLSAAAEMVRGGPIDVLTGDYLSELTMAILHKQRERDPNTGYVATFVAQMQSILGECLARGIKIVTNAGGLNPRGLAVRLGELAAKAGLAPKIAYIEGDDLVPRIGELRARGEKFVNLDRGDALAEDAAIVTANVYLGGWGIKLALDRGADIVVCPRVTDAALVVGPAAHAFGWKRTDWDQLAGAVAAGHILECGMQATGGNYAFFEEVESFKNVGFPIAEMHADGSFVVTKHPNTGGLVSVGTVTAQLLYEIQGPRYVNPDVVARFDSFVLREEGRDRVRVEGAIGEPPPATSKVCINVLGGYKNAITIALSGLDLEKKAEIARAMIATLPQPSSLFTELVRFDREDPRTNMEALAHLRVVAMDRDAARAGRKFSSGVVELLLGGPPGMTLTGPPEDASPYHVHFPVAIDRAHVAERVVIGDEIIDVGHVEIPALASPASGGPVGDECPPSGAPAQRSFVRLPFGRVYGARSGDKGGNASLGVWAKTASTFAHLRRFLTVDELRALLPEVRVCTEIERFELPNLLAVGFVLRGLLGEGVAASTRIDPQAKTLAEYLRAKIVDLPALE